MGKLEALIEQAYLKANKRILHLLYKPFKNHLYAIKQYMLLGKGDFVQYLMDQLLKMDMNLPMAQLSQHALLELVQTSIRMSNAQYDEQEITQRLDVRLLGSANMMNPSQSQSGTGWDGFALDYTITAPLDTIFSAAIMHRYRLIFKLLWQLKRVETLMNDTWKKHVVISKAIHGSKGPIATLLHNCNLIRHELLHFVQAYQHYIMFEVVETLWQQWTQKLDTLSQSEVPSTDLDKLIADHEQLLTQMEYRMLLRHVTSDVQNRPFQQQQQIVVVQTKDVRFTIDKMLHLILQFTHLQDQVHTTVFESLAKQVDKMDDDDEGDAMNNANEVQQQEAQVKMACTQHVQMMVGIRNEYRGLYKAVLSAAAHSHDENVKNLMVLTPFNIPQ